MRLAIRSLGADRSLDLAGQNYWRPLGGITMTISIPGLLIIAVALNLCILIRQRRLSLPIVLLMVLLLIVLIMVVSGETRTLPMVLHLILRAFTSSNC